MNKSYAIVSAILFGIVALLHLLRGFLGWEVAIGDYMLPVTDSWAVFGVAICLAVWGIRGSRSYAAVSATLFSLVALLHLYRVLITHTVVTIDALTVPVTASWVGFVVSGALSVWGFLSYRSL